MLFNGSNISHQPQRMSPVGWYSFLVPWRVGTRSRVDMIVIIIRTGGRIEFSSLIRTRAVCERSHAVKTV